MYKNFVILAVTAALGACGGGIIEDSEGTEETGTGDSGASEAISIHEAVNGNGGGYVTSVVYDPDDNVLIVEGLPFDGDAENPYQHDNNLLGGDVLHAVFESVDSVDDPSGPGTIDQLKHFGIFAEGETTNFAIVRSSDYTDYGFGGFMYMRDGGVVLPTIGQATYSGLYSGIRVYQGTSGLDFVIGVAEVDIDFEHFTDGDAIKGVIRNRSVGDQGYFTISDEVEPIPGEGIPDLIFLVSPGSINEDGSMSTTVYNTLPNADGDATEFEAGTFFGLLSGDNAEEMVGIIVVEGIDARDLDLDGDGGDQWWTEGELIYQETGGFIAARELD